MARTIPGTLNFALELRDALVADYGYDLADLTDEEVIDMFGTGFWKTDKEKGHRDPVLSAGLRAGGRASGTTRANLGTIELICHTEESATQAARSGKAIADQWSKFGINVEVSSLSQNDMYEPHQPRRLPGCDPVEQLLRLLHGHVQQYQRLGRHCL